MEAFDAFWIDQCRRITSRLLESGVPVLSLREVLLVNSVEYDRVVRFEFTNGERYQVAIDYRDSQEWFRPGQRVRWDEIVHRIRHIYGAVAQEAEEERVRRPYQELAEHVARLSPNAAPTLERIRRLQDQHINQLRQLGALAPNPWQDIWQDIADAMFPRNMTATEVMAREQEAGRRLDAMGERVLRGMNPGAFGADVGVDEAAGPDRTAMWTTTGGHEHEPSEAGMVRPVVVRPLQAPPLNLRPGWITYIPAPDQRRGIWDQMREFLGMPPRDFPSTRSPEEWESTEKRAEDLLIEHLSPRQAEEYQQATGRMPRCCFTVIGHHTGHTYRIMYGRAMNIYNLTTGRNLCFHPTGHLAPGDCMLAQKIMLETEEQQALALANVY